MRRRDFLSLVGGTAAISLAARPREAFAQAWPQRVVRIILREIAQAGVPLESRSQAFNSIKGCRNLALLGPPAL